MQEWLQISTSLIKPSPSASGARLIRLSNDDETIAFDRRALNG